MLDLFASLRLTVWILVSAVILFILHSNWPAFSAWLYLPVLLAFYGNLTACMLKRWHGWQPLTLSRACLILFHVGLAVSAGGGMVTALGKFQGGLEIVQGGSFVDSEDRFEWTEGPLLGTPEYSGAFFF